MTAHALPRAQKVIMPDVLATIAESQLLEEILGYLNLSSGAPDCQFLLNLNEIFRRIELADADGGHPWRAAQNRLQKQLAELDGKTPVFNDSEQVRAVLELVFERFLPAYRQYHRDLLFHQPDAALERPLFLGRVSEAVLRQGGPWDEPERIVSDAIDDLNDYIGHRPVAVLHNRRMEPYEHEWIRPLPLWIRDVGPAVGKYHRLIEQALQILWTTDPQLLRSAHFDPTLLDELAVDPRAYDFDHPANKRPNYHFGQWDPHHLDNQARYRRFVVQQVTLDALMERVEKNSELSPDELLAEAAAVLAGTILMASGTSGSGPDAHDSTVTLATLMPKIAAYRDAFYKPLIERMPEPHRSRLREEAVSGRQPFAGARQHLNQALARRRATQLERVHLALLFARLGYPEAAFRQAHVVPVASARIACEILCRLSTGHLAVERGELAYAARLLTEIEDFLHRGIECGALIDPWNILGFQGQFSLFPSPENSMPDHRVDSFIELVADIFTLFARVWSEAAAQSDSELPEALSLRMAALAEWWDRFATPTVDSVESFSGSEAVASARQVAEALQAWNAGGASVGDIGFWRKHVQDFNSPKAYALVVQRLIEKRDVVAAMALLMQWLSQADQVPLKQGEYSFHRLSLRLLDDICHADFSLRGEPSRQAMHDDRRNLVRRFFDHLEANADELWQVPRLDLASLSTAELFDEDDDADDDSRLFQAAYDEMVYKDSTNDGVESEMLESGGPPASDYELEHESRRLRDRLTLLGTVARMWKSVALASGPTGERRLVEDDTLAEWAQHAESNASGLAKLLTAVEARQIPPPTASRDSLMEFDRRRNVKESLLENIIGTAVETAHAARFLRAAAEENPKIDLKNVDLAVWRAVLAGDAARVRELWPTLLGALRAEPVLYVPLAKGGSAARIAAARTVQQSIRDLLRWLPRLGLVSEACQLLKAARRMELDHPVGVGAVTEFDRLFEVGYKSLVESLVSVSRDWPIGDEEPYDETDSLLVESIEQLTESLLREWLDHSRTLRLSVLEKIGDEKGWQSLVKFVEKYGHDLFTQRFLNLGNLRAILHQGVDTWLAQLQEDSEAQDEFLLLRELDAGVSRPEAVRQLSLVIEAIAENYSEYRDYNTTTTQSDRGELLYSLLDFLRLRVQYDRVAWNLRPVILAHEILVRRGCDEAAGMWRRAIVERTSDVAHSLEKRLSELRKKYAMRLPTVSDRLGEKFVRQLAIDRVRALIVPSITERRAQLTGPPMAGAFALLEQEIEELTQEPTGAGLDVPPWLEALEEEAETARRAARFGATDDYELPLSQVPLSLEEIQREIAEWEKR